MHINKKILSLLLSYVLILSFPFSITTFATESNSLQIYTRNGKKYVTIDNQQYQYISIEDFEKVSDLQQLNTLNENQSKSVLATPPTYSVYLTTPSNQNVSTSYTQTINLSNGNQWTPYIKRVPLRYTNFRVDSPTFATLSMGIFYYDSLDQSWYHETLTDQSFNLIIDTYQFEFGSAGYSYEGLRIYFYSFDNTPSSFTYTLWDTNYPA